MQFTVKIEPAVEGGFTVQCVEIPGAISEGETIEEALENIGDAIEEIIAVRREKATRTKGSVRTVEVNA
jgi:predicted RNase H-like HicB family nuclease